MSYTTVTDNEQTIKSYRTLYLVEPVSFLSSAAADAFCKTSSYLSSKANYESEPENVRPLWDESMVLWDTFFCMYLLESYSIYFC